MNIFARAGMDASRQGLKQALSPTGEKIAKKSDEEASSRNTEGKCYNAQADAIEKAVGKKIFSGGSAYMAADQFVPAGFKEVTNQFSSNEALQKLSRGFTVVFDPKQGHPHGHITTSLGDQDGDGKVEFASDYKDTKGNDANYGKKFRVFAPPDTQRLAAPNTQNT